VNISVSKKALESKREELLGVISEPLLSYCKDNLETMIRKKPGCEILVETLLHAQGEKTTIFGAVAEMTRNEEENNILQDIVSSRAIVRLLKEDPSSTFAQLLVQKIENKEKWAQKKGSSFVILCLLEHSVVGSQVKDELKSHLKSLSSCEESTCQLIVNKLK